MEPNTTQVPDDIAAIKQVYDDWTLPWETGDAAGVASYYTEDAVQMPSSEPDIVGREAAQSSLQAVFDDFTVKGNAMDIQEVEIAGDLAFARGTYALTVTPKADGEPTHYTGKFLHLFKRQPEGWKIHRAIGADDQLASP